MLLQHEVCIETENQTSSRGSFYQLSSEDLVVVIEPLRTLHSQLGQLVFPNFVLGIASVPLQCITCDGGSTGTLFVTVPLQYISCDGGTLSVGLSDPPECETINLAC